MYCPLLIKRYFTHSLSIVHSSCRFLIIVANHFNNSSLEEFFFAGMPPKNAVSQLERNRARDRRLTRDDWLRERKPTLRQRCALYGLSLAGKKAALTERLLEYLHGEI